MNDVFVVRSHSMEWGLPADCTANVNNRRHCDMSKKMRITVTIEDENGEAIVTNESERTVPYIEEIDEQGFRTAFHQLETAVLESRKEACDGAVSEYLEKLSKKNGITGRGMQGTRREGL